MPHLQKKINPKESFLVIMAFLVAALLMALVFMGTRIFDKFMPLSFFWRTFIVGLILFPLGFCLGMFFPAGLELINKKYQPAIAWAWGINCGFSVLGSILSIILAQMMGFNAILLLASCIYLISLLAYRRMAAAIVATTS